MAVALSFLDLANEITPEVMTLLHYFAKDTTERILLNVKRMKVGDSGALASSIQATVYQNAGGNDALVRFYYLNYAGYLEQGLGYLRGVDDDLSETLKRGGTKRHGVKATNVRPVDAIGGSNFDPIAATIRKATKAPKGDAVRGQKHKAKPFLHSEIRLHLRGTQKRLAMALAYTATAYLTRGMVQATYELVANEKGVEKWKEDVQAFGDKWTTEQAQATGQFYKGFRFISDMSAEDAWLKAKGYLKHVERDWGLSSFRSEVLK